MPAMKRKAPEITIFYFLGFYGRGKMLKYLLQVGKEGEDEAVVVFSSL